MIITDEIYKKFIPSWCTFQTIEEHRNYLGFCWGLMENIKNNDSPRTILNSCQNCKYFDINADQW